MKELKTDEELATVLDDLMHFLKPLRLKSRFANDFNNYLTAFIFKHNLDQDKDAFVVLPPRCRLCDNIPTLCVCKERING